MLGGVEKCGATLFHENIFSLEKQDFFGFMLGKNQISELASDPDSIQR